MDTHSPIQTTDFTQIIPTLFYFFIKRHRSEVTERNTSTALSQPRHKPMQYIIYVISFNNVSFSCRHVSIIHHLVKTSTFFCYFKKPSKRNHFKVQRERTEREMWSLPCVFNNSSVNSHNYIYRTRMSRLHCEAFNEKRARRRDGYEDKTTAWTNNFIQILRHLTRRANIIMKKKSILMRFVIIYLILLHKVNIIQNYERIIIIR